MLDTFSRLSNNVDELLTEVSSRVLAGELALLTVRTDELLTSSKGRLRRAPRILRRNSCCSGVTMLSSLTDPVWTVSV